VAQVMALIGVLMRWLGKRTVEREDRDKEELRRDFDTMEARVKELDRAIFTMQNEVKATHAVVTAISGQVTEVRANLDSRLEKQASFYREELEKHSVAMSTMVKALEFQVRQDTTRAIHDASALVGKKR